MGLPSSIDNIILDPAAVDTLPVEDNEYVLFSDLPANAKPIVPYKLDTHGIEYPRYVSHKCAICNSPHRTLLEYVYIDKNKKYNAVLQFFKTHYNARLNWHQVKQHLSKHCDFTRIETPGLLDYEDRHDEIGRWKYRELELSETAILLEMNDIRGMGVKNNDEMLKRSNMIDKLVGRLLAVRDKRQSYSMGLPNVFEVLNSLHNEIYDEESKRIIREKIRELKDSLIET